MAGDWIKMRVWLCRDPRVIRMADHLAGDRCFMNWLTDPVRKHCDQSAYEHVTRNVITALCVTGLLVTWGTAREQGDRDGDDLVLNHADLYTLDAMTDLPGFGEAMESVGWVCCKGDDSICFPKFFKENESPEEKHKRQNAERQARHRAKSNAIVYVTGDASNNVTVTLEKRREENNNKPASKRIAFDEAAGKWLDVDPAEVALWKAAYPAIDVDAEMLKAAAWLKANPKNRKSNYAKFLTGWFSRTQDRAPRVDTRNHAGTEAFRGAL